MEKKLLLSALLSIMTLCGWCDEVQTFVSKTVEGIELCYTVVSEDEKTCKVDECNKETISGTVTIPAMVNGYTVVLIEKETFKGCPITKVNIPGTVKTIAESAFRNCNDLTEIVIPEGVETIGEYAFDNCKNAVSLSLPSTLKSIAYSAFDGGNKRTKVIISDLASWCAVELENNSSVFNYHEPSYETTHLYSDANTEIVDLVIPEGVTTIGSSVFKNLYTIKSVVIPEGVTTIGTHAFRNCSGLESISFPSTLTKIHDGGFGLCDNLRKFIITDIANWCSNVSGLSEIYTYSGTPSYQLFSDENTEIKELIIPEGVQKINNAFKYCTGLTSVVIPSSVKEIEERAFYNCTGLQGVYSRINIPFAIDSTAFGNSSQYANGIIYSIVPLYVPKGRANIYKSTKYWNKFATIEEGEPQGSTATLTVKQADNGTVGIQVSKGSTHTLTIKAENGWKIHSVTFNGQDVTSQLSNGQFTTPTVTEDGIRAVVYEKEGGSAVREVRTSSAKVTPTAFGVTVTGAIDGQNILIYNEGGILQQAVSAKGEQTDILLQKDALYIIKIGDKVMKLRH